MSASVALSREKWSIGTRCQGYIGDFVLGCHAKDMVALCFGKFMFHEPVSLPRTWSIPSEDPYEEAARQLLEQAPCSPEYVPDPMELEDHVPVYIPEPEHPEDLVPAEDEAPIEAYITEGPTIVTYTQSTALSTSRRADIPEADTPPRKRLLLTTPRPSCEVGESSTATAARQPGPTMAHRVDYSLVDTMETWF
ncbi:hypothetical protein Tco_1466940 [Tanacetum coccineum]